MVGQVAASNGGDSYKLAAFTAGAVPDRRAGWSQQFSERLVLTAPCGDLAFRKM